MTCLSLVATLSVLAAAQAANPVDAPPAPTTAPAVTPAPTIAPPPVSSFDTVDKVAARSPEYATLARAITAAGLAPTLEDAGPYTIFAPIESAFQKLPAGTLDTLLQTAQADRLATLLKLHVVAGYLAPSELRKQLKADGGAGRIMTLAGETLTARLSPTDDITIEDANGTIAHIAGGERTAFNGLLIPIDAVEMPAPPPAPARKRR